MQGISDEELAAAPTWPEVDARLVPLLKGRELVAWNAAFDRRVLRRSSPLDHLTWLEAAWRCAVDGGAPIWGESFEALRNLRGVNLDVACREVISLGAGRWCPRCSDVRNSAGRPGPEPLPA